MKKYLGIIKIETKSAIGLEIRLLTKFSDDIIFIQKWMELYPNAEKITINNSEVLEKFFKDFEDYNPVTEEEKEKAEKLYLDFKKQI